MLQSPAPSLAAPSRASSLGFPAASSRPKPLRHAFARSEESSLAESESPSEADSQTASASESFNEVFNEATWAEAYVSHNPQALALGPLPALAALPVFLDWDEDGGDDEDDEEGGENAETHQHDLDLKSAEEENTDNKSSPMIPARYPHSSLPLSSANSKRFSDPHGSSTLSSASPRNTFPRRTSSSVTTSPVLGGKTSNHSLQHISYSPKHKLKGMRRYSHAATCISSGSDDMDHDDRFINTVATHLKELDALEQQTEAASILQHQESLQTTRQPKRTSFLLSLLGSSSNSGSPNPSTPTSPALQPSDPTSQQQQQPSPLVSFISRAFGPRRNLQHHRRPASHMPSLSELQQQQQQQTQQNQRASMPHMSWSSWTSSNTSRRNSRTTSISSINSQVPLQQPQQQQHPQGTTTTRTTKETRTKLTQALKLFEMGATEAAFATFRVCLQETNGSDPFVEYCVAVCLVHGYGCSGTGQDYDDGVEILKKLRDGGSVLARMELALLEEEEV